MTGWLDNAPRLRVRTEHPRVRGVVAGWREAVETWWEAPGPGQQQPSPLSDLLRREMGPDSAETDAELQVQDGWLSGREGSSTAEQRAELLGVSVRTLAGWQLPQADSAAPGTAGLGGSGVLAEAGLGDGLAWLPGGGGVPGVVGEAPEDLAALAAVLDEILAEPGGQVPVPARDVGSHGREDSDGLPEPAPAALGLVPDPPDADQQEALAAAGLEWVEVRADGDCLMSALLAAAPPGTFGADAWAMQIRDRMAEFLAGQIADSGPFWPDWAVAARTLLAEDRANREAAGDREVAEGLRRYYQDQPLTSADHSELVAAMRQPGEWGHAAADLAPAVAAATFGLDLTIIQPRGFSNRFHAPGRPAVTIIRVPGHWHAARDAASRPGTTTRRASAPAVRPPAPPPWPAGRLPWRPAGR